MEREREREREKENNNFTYLCCTKKAYGVILPLILGLSLVGESGVLGRRMGTTD